VSDWSGKSNPADTTISLLPEFWEASRAVVRAGSDLDGAHHSLPGLSLHKTLGHLVVVRVGEQQRSQASMVWPQLGGRLQVL
jgi:hypothetical protein